MSVACHDDWASSTSDRHSQSRTATFNPLGSVYQSMCCGSGGDYNTCSPRWTNPSTKEPDRDPTTTTHGRDPNKREAPFLGESSSDHCYNSSYILAFFPSYWLVPLLVSTLSWTESAKQPSSTAGTVRLQPNLPFRRGRDVGARAARECVYFIKLHHLLIYHPIQFGESSVCFWLLFTLTSVCSSTRAAMRMFRDVCFSWNRDDGWSGRKKGVLLFKAFRKLTLMW